MFMENNFIIKIDRDIKKGLIIFFLIMAIPVLYLIISDNAATKKQLLEIERFTRVIKIYENKEEHNFLYVEFSDKKIKILEYPYKIGDSISKKKGDSIEYIFRNGVVIQNNLLKNYRKSRGSF